MTSEQLTLLVEQVRDHSSEVRTLTLKAVHGDLPPYVPGSNLAVEWSPGRYNSYSLTGDGYEPCSYSISVRRQDDGQGGSAWMHGLAVGEQVRAKPPSSEFPPVWSARHHLLLAGGIGVTPILSHARVHARWSNSFEIHFVARDHVLLNDLRNVAGDRLHLHDSRSAFHSELDELLRSQRIGTHLYVCGPESMIEAVKQAARDAHWPTVRVHSEAFAVSMEPGEPFTVTAQRSGHRIHVSAGETLLAALQAAGLQTRSQCRRGFCGECLTRVVSGDIDHRDDYLEATVRERGEHMLTCVSRGRGEIVLDL